MFSIKTRLNDALGRTGVISTPHGQIRTPAFIPVGTRASVRGVLPEKMAELGAQALLANAYHLYLQPGHDIVAEAGGLASFMNWSGPTFTDSGGFQVLSLGAGFKKTLAMDAVGKSSDDVIAPGKERLARVDDDGVTFKSHIDGSRHRFTPEVSMQIQHDLGADIIFAFDELTTLMNTRRYQEEALERTRLWAQRCIAELARLTEEHPQRPRQGLFGVIQGAQYEDLRRTAARDLGAMDFAGFGVGGAIEKENLGLICQWVNSELPEAKPRHLLGIGEPEDLFEGVENGCDTFDCVGPSRVARSSRVYTSRGRYNLNVAASRRNFGPIDEDCSCYTCQNYSRAYLRHLFKAGESNAGTLCTIHNEHFVVNLVDQMRQTIDSGDFFAFKSEFLGRYRDGKDYAEK